MTEPFLTVETEKDWPRFRAGKLESVVDPMVFRTADLYLRGSSGAERHLGKPAEEIWRSISSNLGALSTFFDRFILEGRLPLIDYGYTFDSNVGYDPAPLQRTCNEAAQGEVLVHVHVMGEAYVQAKDRALSVLGRAGPLDPRVAREVGRELSDFDYGWRPDLGDVDVADDTERSLATFVFGGLLFGTYAQAAGAAHVLQPKRAGLHLETSLNVGVGKGDRDDVLLGELQAILESEGMASALLQTRESPLFLPYLLSRDPNGPFDLLKAAGALRATGEVQDLRAWQSTLLEDWEAKGRIDAKAEGRLREISARVEKSLGPRDFSGKVGISAAGVTVSAALAATRLVGWAEGLIPGRRYMKLLHRLYLSAHEYREMDRHLKTLWERS